MKIGQDEIFAWVLDVPDENAIQPLRTSLTVDELKRADQFSHLPSKREYIFGRHLIRHQLAKLMRLGHPTEVPLTILKSGKPVLANGAFAFSLSHSNQKVAVAICRSRTVGIDIESTSRTLDYQSLVPSVLSPSEVGRLPLETEDQRREAFLRIWTAKEALTKATGEGLGADFPTIDINILGEQPSLIEQGQPCPDWYFFQDTIAEGFWLSIAAQRNSDEKLRVQIYTSF